MNVAVIRLESLPELHHLPYTNRAKNVLDDAYAFSNECGSLSVNTEHLACVLTRADSHSSASIHNSLKHICSRIYSTILESVEFEDDNRIPAADLFPDPLHSPNFKNSINNAMDIANELDHFVVNSEHILLGLLKLDSDTTADKIRSIADWNIDDIYRLVSDCSSVDIHCGSRQLKIDG